MLRNGQIFSKKLNRFLSTKEEGYSHVGNWKFHQIIWTAVYGDIPLDKNGKRCIIHHINGNKKDNRISNLELVDEWGKHTHTYHSGENCKLKNKPFTEEHKKKLRDSSLKRGKCKAIYQIDENTNEIISEYSSIAEASRAINGVVPTIWKVLRGERNSAYGFKWEYKKNIKLNE